MLFCLENDSNIIFNNYCQLFFLYFFLAHLRETFELYSVQCTEYTDQIFQKYVKLYTMNFFYRKF